MSTEESDLCINSLLDRLDGKGSDSEWKSVFELRSILGDRLPEYLFDRYRHAKNWQVRCSCVFHSIKYAQTSISAIDMALIAINDRSKVVRYRACMLLACSQKKDLLPHLRTFVDSVSEDTRADILAAIDAIESENRNYFVDRDHSGLVTLEW